MEQLVSVLPAFALVFCRITAFLAVAPIFSSRGIPIHFKIGIAFFVSLLTFTAIGVDEVDDSVVVQSGLVLTLIKELIMGLLLGFAATMIFSAVQIAGSFVDMQLGFGIANVMDPMTGAQSPILGNLKFLIAVLLFLSVNGHHYMLKALIDSYDFVPLTNNFLPHLANGNVTTLLLSAFVRMFELAFLMAAPLVVTLFLVDLSLGILARTAPQFNVFVIGLPLKLIVGLFVLVLVIPGIIALFNQLFSLLFQTMHELTQLVK